MDPDRATPSDEVLDLIGGIAMHRQAMEHDPASGVAPARNEALRRLNELLATSATRCKRTDPAAGIRPTSRP